MGFCSQGVLVCDDGPAIPETDRERIFQPYQRAHDTPGVADSLGLGLAISRQLGQLMGVATSSTGATTEKAFSNSASRYKVEARPT
jgi:K+-sensing histidine kinase KdpD